MATARDRAPDRVPRRRCLVRRTADARDQLIRFVLDPEQRVVPDLDERLPGRGMWLSADRDVVNRAVAGKLFARTARAPATAEANLADKVEQLLAKRALECIGLARRAGQVRPVRHVVVHPGVGQAGLGQHRAHVLACIHHRSRRPCLVEGSTSPWAALASIRTPTVHP